MMALVGGDSV